MSPRVARWLAAWQGDDPQAVAALYASDCRHESARIAAAMPELGRSYLIGPGELREYAARAFERLAWRRFELAVLIETGEFSVLEYWRHTPLEPAPSRVCEVLQWRDGRLIRSCAYHF